MNDPAINLARRVERYLKRAKQAPTAFGMAVSRNPSLVSRIRSGKIGLQTIRIVTTYLNKQESP